MSQQNVLDVLSSEPKTAAEIARITGFETDQVATFCYGLHKSHKIRRVSVPNPSKGKGVRPTVYAYLLHKLTPVEIPPPEDEDFDDNEAMPPANHELLASANRMLHERLEGVAHVLRGCGLEGLKDCQAEDDLQMKAAALAGAYQTAIASVYLLTERLIEQKNMVDELTARYVAPQAALDVPVRQPLGYAHMWKEGFLQFNTEADARADIEQAFLYDNSIGSASPSHLVAILATAEMAVRWKESA